MVHKPLDISDAEGSNTYFIYVDDSLEAARLIRQAQLGIELQGELYPAVFDHITSIRRVLDVACGPGGWAIEMARAKSDRSIVGFDISTTMLDYARMFAEAEGVANVEFVQMDALGRLDFSDGEFDLVNANYLYSVLTPGAWPDFLLECKRVLRPGGLMKITELEGGVTSSPAAEELYRIWAKTMKLAGRSFSCDGMHHGTTPMLKPLLHNAGYVSIDHKPYALDCSEGTVYNQAFFEDVVTISRHMGPFVRRVAGEEDVHRQRELIPRAQDEIRAPGFAGMVYLLTAWGVKPDLESGEGNSDESNRRTTRA